MSFTPAHNEIVKFCGPKALTDWVDAMVRLAPDLCEHYNFNRLDWVHFMGQVGAETNGMALRKMQENMTFTTTRRIVEVYSYRLRRAINRVNSGKYSEPAIARGRSVVSLASKLRRKSTLLANIVYGGREGTPWMQGSLYVGRGPFQVTHKNGYDAVSKEIAKQPGGGVFDLVGEPEKLASDPELGVRSAFADWHIKGLTRYAQRDSVYLVSDLLNTGNVNDRVKPHGLSNRKRWTAKAKGVWPRDRKPVVADETEAVSEKSEPVVVAEAQDAVSAQPEPVAGRFLRQGDQGDDVRALQEKLKALGYQVGYRDGKFGRLTRRAVVALQDEHDLHVDGIVGPRTMDVLETTAPADLGERETITAKELKKRGSTQITLWSRLRKFGHALWVGSGLAGIMEVSGLQVLERASTTADKLGGFVGKLKLPEGLSSPLVWMTIILAAVGIGGLLLVAWGKSGEDDRVQKARSGQDISK